MSSDWNPAYIGDGVYAFFDGNGVERKLGAHYNKCAVYLEPGVIENLEAFWARCQKEGEGS